MSLSFIGYQRHVWAAQRHRYAPFPKLCGDFIDVWGAWRMKGDGNQINFQRNVNRRDRFINMEYFPLFWHKGHQIGHCDLLKVQHARSPHFLDPRGGSCN